MSLRWELKMEGKEERDDGERTKCRAGIFPFVRTED